MIIPHDPLEYTSNLVPMLHAHFVISTLEAAADESRALRKVAPHPPEADVDEMWFKSMWLSNGDFLRYFTAALDVGVARGELLLLNAMSANTGMRWSIAETEAALGVRAVDNSLPNHA